MSTPTLLPDVERHFKDLAENPDKIIDVDLLDKLELQITGASQRVAIRAILSLPKHSLTVPLESIDGSIVQNLVLKIAQLILTVRHDASPLASLGTKLVNISRLTFSDLA